MEKVSIIGIDLAKRVLQAHGAAPDGSVARPMATRKERPTTVTSDARAIILCSCSTSSATWNGVRSVPATFTAPMAGARCWSR